VIFTERDRLSLATAGEWYTMKLIKLLRDRGGDLAVHLLLGIMSILVGYLLLLR